MTQTKEKINVGDFVIDRLNGQRFEVIDIITRDDVTLFTLADGHGSTTNVTREWITKQK